MTFISKNILNYYQYNDHNEFYLLKNFSNIGYFGAFKSFEYKPFSEGPHNRNKVKTLDDCNTYDINELGLRGTFNINAEIIGAGCSFTFGVGIPEEGTWVKLLQNKINKNIINFGLPGHSVTAICQSLISYCTNYNIPKKIFCVFPDLFRSIFIEDFEYYSSKKWVREQVENYRLNLTSVNPSIYFNPTENKMYSTIEDRSIHAIEDALSPHQLIINSIDSIALLEYFCKTNEIELFWTTWDPGSAYIIDLLLKIPNFKLKKYNKFVTEINYNNYLNSDATFNKNMCNSNHDLELSNHKCWDIGSDYVIIDGSEKPNWASHPGIHLQAHLSDFFESLIK